MATLQELQQQRDALTGGYNTGLEDTVSKIKKEQNYDTVNKGLTDTRNAINETDRILGSLPTDIKQRNAGRLVTASQENRILGKERDPLVTQLSGLSRTQNTQQQGIQSILDLINQGKEGYTQGFNLKLGGINSDIQQAFADQQRAKAAQDAASLYGGLYGGGSDTSIPTNTANPGVRGALGGLANGSESYTTVNTNPGEGTNILQGLLGNVQAGKNQVASQVQSLSGARPKTRGELDATRKGSGMAPISDADYNNYVNNFKKNIGGALNSAIR